MKYITGQHALNLPCELNTCGDWHTSALQWEKPFMKDSQGSTFGDYGIEADKKIPEHEERYYVANHIRALLDLLEIGKFSVAQGMRDDFICNDSYDEEIFGKVFVLKDNANWNDIDSFMCKEYNRKWRKYKEEQCIKV